MNLAVKDYRGSRRRGAYDVPVREPEITSEQSRNDPTPIIRPESKETHVHLAHSNRNNAIVTTIKHVNALLAWECGSTVNDLPLPGQGNVDERMPLFFLRPCIPALNDLIEKYKLDIALIPEYGDSIDYHGVILMINQIINHANRILELLPDNSQE